MLIGEKHERVVVDGSDLLRPYAIRPAVRPIVEYGIFPAWVRPLAILAALPFGILVLAAIVHAMLPTIR
jgi:hypothetical protein